MRVLVYPHDLGMGGSQTNAVEIAAKIRDLGVESIVFGRPGVLNRRIDALGLEFIASPDPGRRPSIRIARLLRSIARERGVDLLHGYEWPPSLECMAAAYGLRGTTAVSTVMSMAVAPFIPTTMPLVVGTEQIADAERRRGRRQVQVIEPPVDLDHNVAPSAAELAAFRQRWALRPGATSVVCVSRLADELKSEGILSTIAAMGDRFADLDLQFLLVGDGPARERVAAAAADANARAGRDVVIMTGELLDPRAAYAVADVVIGMGGSALRALAFGKPLIVQGERGFFELLNEDSWPTFAWQGWYGVGSSVSSGVDQLERALRAVLASETVRVGAAGFGRDLVHSRFSLEAAARSQLGVYEDAVAGRGPGTASTSSLVVAGARFTAHTVVRKARSGATGRATDDFNASPVAASTDHDRDADGTVVYLAGVQWDDVPGTDYHLATALAKYRRILWVDPTSSVVRRLEGQSIPPLSTVGDNIRRLHPMGPPAVTRPGMRALARHLTAQSLRRHLGHSGTSIGAVLSTSPEPLLQVVRAPAAPRFYYATDDYVAGAELMGMSRRHLQHARTLNVEAADVVLAVTPELLRRLGSSGRPEFVHPNGCDTRRYATVPTTTPSAEVDLPGPRVGIIGQLNQRLDLASLEAIADSGLSLLMVGPVVARDSVFVERVRRLTQRPNVQWLDRRPADQLPALLAAVDVGLTPYVANDFNRASFPLKTLEYLAAGIPVVSTDLPAARRMDPRFVSVVADPTELPAAVRRLLTVEHRPSATEAQSYARRFDWERRARDLADLMDVYGTVASTGRGVVPAAVSGR